MKAAFIFLILISFYRCGDINALNNKIYEAQKQAVLQSPYKSASGAVLYVEVQKDFRLNNLPKLVKSKVYRSRALNDTIFMTESFDAICVNCPSDWMKILLRDTVYSIRKEIVGHKGGNAYKVETEPFKPVSKDFQYELRNSELLEIVSKIRSGGNWTNNPLQYGADHCNDGDHTMLTVVYPDKM